MSSARARRRGVAAVAAVAVLGAVVGVLLSSGGSTSDPPELARYAGEWPAPNHDAAGTRAAAGSRIDAANVRRLRLAWRFRFTTQPGLSGIYASTPLVLGGRVYLQDLNSNVYALDEATGRLLWRKRFAQMNGGPNGLAAGYGRVYGNTSRAAFALDAVTGELVWLRRLVHRRSAEIDVAPIAANGLVYTSTIGRPPGGRGVIYALDAATGRVRWTFDTILGTWAVPAEAAGGGVWWPLSVDDRGRVYAGNSNPYPWGGTARHPNGGAYRGRALYTDSLLVLDGRSGKLDWYDQVIPHDVRDYDLGVSPIVARHDGRERRLRRREGRIGLRMGPRDGTTPVAEVRGSAPKRSRSATPAQGERLPRPPRRSRDADGVRRRESLRAGCRPVHARQRHRLRRPLRGRRRGAG